MRTRALSLVVLAATSLAACDATPTTAPIVDEPLYLIGQSPLLPVFSAALDPATGIMLGGSVDLTVEVNKGLTRVADADRFTLRTAVAFRSIIDPKNDPVAAINPKIDPVAAIDPKDGGLRQGSTVPFKIEVPLPTDVWLTLLTHRGGFDAEADVSLVLTTGSGSEQVLDGVVTAATVDPKDTGVLAPESVTLEAKELGDGTIERSLSMGLYLPETLTADGVVDDFVLRAATTFSRSGDPVAEIDPKDIGLTDGATDPKDTGVALVVIALPIDEATWAALDGAVSKPGDLVESVIDIELIAVLTDGSEVAVDAVTAAGTVDPKDQGLPTKEENDPSKG